MIRFSHRPGGIREMLALALPMVVSLSFDTLMTFIDRLFLSRLSPASMSAALAGGNASFLMGTLSMGLIGYATAMVAQRIGSGQAHKTSSILLHALAIAVLSYPLILFLLKPLAYQLFSITEIDPTQWEQQRLYFDILVYGSLVGLLRHSFSSFFSGIGETRIIMFASLVGLVVNVTLNYLLIFGNWGFPALGIQGAAIGTICSGLASLAVLVAKFLTLRIRSRYHQKGNLRFNKSLMSEYIRKGMPSGVEMLLNLGASQLMILLFHGKGIVNATAATIMFNWDMVSFVPLIGLEIATTSLVGRAYGAKDRAALKRSTRSGILIGWGFSLVVLTAFLAIPEALVNVFRPSTPDANFAASFPLAVTMLRISSIYIMIEAIMIVFAGALRGIGDTFATMWIMVGLHWLLVINLWFVYHYLDLGIINAWISMVFGFMLFPLLLWLRWRHQLQGKGILLRR